MDPDQARQNVGPDLGPNCLQKLSAEDTRSQSIKTPSHEFAQLYMSQCMRFLTVWFVRPAKPQISLRICAD